MKLLRLTWLLYLGYFVSINCVYTSGLNINYDSVDTVVLEANLDDDVETTTVTNDDGVETTAQPGERQSRENGEGEGPSCITNSGLRGTCESVQECFPRLFPLNPDNEDTPNRSGVYNQNLLKILIEYAGFCGASGMARDNLAHVKKLHVCCASVKATDEFPVPEKSNITMEDFEEASTKGACGAIKVDANLLPDLEKDKIVGGREAELGEFPWMVAMLRRGQQFCGGSLIDERNVLTAAHCVEFMTKHDVAALRLHIGDLNIYSNKETPHVERKAKRVLYHKGFTMKNLAHDIALIHLDKPVVFSETIQPVCLHSGEPPYDTGKSYADVAGWGTTSSGGPQSSKLLAVRIRVITNTECNQKYKEKNKMVGPGMVCAGSQGKDSCQGDSGGPLVVDGRSQAKQIGIVSWGIGCASYPGVYTRVDKYIKWIKKNRQ